MVVSFVNSEEISNFIRFVHLMAKMQIPSQRRQQQICRREAQHSPVALEIFQMNCEAKAFDTPGWTIQTHAQGPYVSLYG